MRLALAKRLLSADPNDPNVEHINAAVEWLFEALQQTNETLEFVQTCTAMEAILGSKAGIDRYGVTDQLADRCGFLLGKSRTDREGIRKAFRTLYDARSQLVHGIAVRLDDKEQLHLWKARNFIERLLEAEMQRLPH